MLIAHISDTHTVEAGSLAYDGRVDTNAWLEAAIARINALTPQPDLILVTGDLADHGKAEEYDALIACLSKAEPKVFVGIGNHDHRQVFEEKLRPVFDYLPADGFAQYVIEDFPVRIIMLDSKAPQGHEGEFCKTRAAWLDARLNEKPDTPTIIGIHHPPFNTGIKWMDGAGDGWTTHLQSVVAQHDQIIRIVCGHIHRAISAEFGGRFVQAIPSTAHQVEAMLDPDFRLATHLPQFEMEPPGFQLLRWDGKNLTGHILHTQVFDKFRPIPRELLDKIRSGENLMAKAPPQ